MRDTPQHHHHPQTHKTPLSHTPFSPNGCDTGVIPLPPPTHTQAKKPATPPPPPTKRKPPPCHSPDGCCVCVVQWPLVQCVHTVLLCKGRAGQVVDDHLQEGLRGRQPGLVCVGVGGEGGSKEGGGCGSVGASTTCDWRCLKKRASAEGSQVWCVCWGGGEGWTRGGDGG